MKYTSGKYEMVKMTNSNVREYIKVDMLMYKIEVKNLTKIFGSSPKEGLKRLSEGPGKEKILDETGMNVG